MRGFFAQVAAFAVLGLMSSSLGWWLGQEQGLFVGLTAVGLSFFLFKIFESVFSA